MVARKAMTRLRAHGRAVAPDPGNHAHRFERVEIEDRQSLFKRRYRRRGRRRLARLRRSSRDVQSAADRVRKDVVRTALTTDPRGLEHLVRPPGLREAD